MRRYLMTTVMAVAVGVTLTNIRAAEGKLVYESELQPVQQVQTREGIAVRYRDPVADVPAQQVLPVQQIQVAQAEPVAMSASAERAEITKSEMMRRQRLREELRNEDILTQKLEELRLKDENRRTADILGQHPATLEPTPALQEQRVGIVAQAAPAAAPVVVSAVSKTEETAPVVKADAQVAKEDDEDKTRVSIIPRGGLTGIINSNSNAYDITSNYSFGVGLGVDINDYVAFMAGYSYSDYSFASANNNYYYAGYATFQRMEMTDHMFDMGIRANFLPVKAKFRPFIGGGVGYRRGNVNYDAATLTAVRQYYGGTTLDPIELSSTLGYIETGVEFKMTKSISLNGMVRYYNVFNSRVNNPLNPYGYGYSGYGDIRSQAATTISANNLYQLMMGLSVSF